MNCITSTIEKNYLLEVVKSINKHFSLENLIDCVFLVNQIITVKTLISKDDPLAEIVEPAVRINFHIRSLHLLQAPHKDKQNK